jgi:hypothetical protein
MSHESKYLSYNVETPRSRIEAEINHYVSCRTIEEGGHGLNDPIRWMDKTFNNYDEACEYIDSINKPYDQIAVKYRVYPEIKSSATMLELKNKLAREQKKRVEYAAQHSIKTLKAEYIGCPCCGSKLKRELLKTEKCVLCGTDLRSKTTLDTLSRYSKNIEDLQKKIKAEHCKLESKMIKASTVKWLVKIEYHV